MVVTCRIIEQCQVSPSPGAPAQLVLKLLHFDIAWLISIPVKMLFFYKLQRFESHFLDTIVPNLKTSLSLSLKHFAPLAGRILVPRENSTGNNRTPVAHYVDGEDSASLTIAICRSSDFSNLTSRRSREAGELDDLVPRRLPPESSSSTVNNIPVIAFQVTLFPDQGVCVSFTGHHSICDINTMMRFLRTWAEFNGSSHGEEYLHLSECLPNSYDRDVVAGGDRLALEFWEGAKAFSSAVVARSISAVSLKERIVRTTFIFNEADIKTLKRHAAKILPVSSYVVVCAHLWTSLAKSSADASSGEEDEPEYFMCPFDCRHLLNPPLPDTYFRQLQRLSETPFGRLWNTTAAVWLIFPQSQLLEIAKRAGERILIVGGSPKLDFYAPDYGWGRPVDFEILDGEHNGMAVFTNSPGHKGGMEVCVSMPKVKMDAFAALFRINFPTQQSSSKL